MDEMKVTNGDITLRVEVTGDGPTVLCVPGWPELAGSYHHQVEHLAANGLPSRGARRAWIRRQLRPDRGRAVLAAPARRRRRCGRRALDDGPIVLVGHDWGAPIVWNTAIRHPDRVRAVAGLSVPHTPPFPISLLDLLDQVYPAVLLHALLRKPGVPEAAFAADMRGALKRVYFALSGDSPLNCWIPEAPRDAEFLPAAARPARRTAQLPQRRRPRCGSRDASSAPAWSARSTGTAPLRSTPPRTRTSWAPPVGQPSCFIAGSARSGEGVHPRQRRLRRSGIGMHRLPGQHDHRGRRPLGAPGEAGRGERGAARVSSVVGVTLASSSAPAGEVLLVRLGRGPQFGVGFELRLELRPRRLPFGRQVLRRPVRMLLR